VSDPTPAGVTQVARLYTDIALLRRGPEDVPASAALLALTVLAYLLASLGLSTLMPVASDNRVALIALDGCFALAWYWVVLRLAGRPERFVQTAAAIFGYQTVMAPAFVTATWLFLQYMKDPVWQLPVSLLLLVLAIWTLAVNSRILKAATEWPQFVCVAVVILQALAGQIIELGLFPQSAGS
jgi:hypothetical protein